MYSRSLVKMTLLPHKCVTQRQDPHMAKCLDIQLYDIFLMGNGRFQTLAIRAVIGAPSLWPNCGMCFVLNPKSGPKWSILIALPNGVAEGDNNVSLFAEDKQRSVDLNSLPTCVLHSGTFFLS